MHAHLPTTDELVPNQPYPRDLCGYGRAPPDPRWPGGARVAVQFVLNYEEGGRIAFFTAIPHPRHSSPKS